MSDKSFLGRIFWARKKLKLFALTVPSVGKLTLVLFSPPPTNQYICMIPLQFSILIKSPLTCQHELVFPINCFFIINGFWTHCLWYGKPKMLSICTSPSCPWCVVTSNVGSEDALASSGCTGVPFWFVFVIFLPSPSQCHPYITHPPWVWKWLHSKTASHLSFL